MNLANTVINQPYIICIMEKLLDYNSIIKLLSINKNMNYSRKYIRKLICYVSNKSICKFVEKFKGLRLLTITNNRNTDFKNIIFPKNLHSLNLSNNFLSSDNLENIKFPPKLRVLNLYNNNIEYINFTIPKKLRWLDISSNMIKSLNNVDFPKSLKMIALNSNSLNDNSFDNFNVPKQLKMIDISGNCISKEKLEFICNNFNIIVKCYCINQSGPLLYMKPGIEYNNSHEYLFNVHLEYNIID